MPRYQQLIVSWAIHSDGRHAQHLVCRLPLCETWQGQSLALVRFDDHKAVGTTCVHVHITSQARQQSSPQSFDRLQQSLEMLLRC